MKTSRSLRVRKKTFVRKADDPNLFLIEVFVEGEDERPEWGPLEEAWAMDPDDFPEDMAGEHGGVVVTLDADAV
jgi:hypothetical protein